MTAFVKFLVCLGAMAVIVSLVNALNYFGSSSRIAIGRMEMGRARFWFLMTVMSLVFTFTLGFVMDFIVYGAVF